jgi:hypothetical protein
MPSVNLLLPSASSLLAIRSACPCLLLSPATTAWADYAKSANEVWINKSKAHPTILTKLLVGVSHNGCTRAAPPYILAFVSLVTMRWTEPSIVEGIEGCCQAGRLGRCQIANSNWRNDQGTDE